MPDKKQILNSIAAIAKRLGRAPSRAEFTSQSGISAFFVLHWFRSWSDAVKAAGLRPYTLNKRIEDRALLEDWGKAVRKNRAVPPRHIYLLEGRYNPGTLAKRFGGYSSVPQAFRNFAKGRREWRDVLALLPAPLPEWRRGQPAKKAASAILPDDGKQCPTNRNASRCISRKKAQYAALKDRAMCGNPIESCGLRYEPVNEQGVVLLFGMLAKDLGYVVEAVQTGFPDCEARRQVSADRWQRVNVEFEFESKNFRDHGHSANGCDVIVCWRHNWHDCPNHIEVLDLSRVIQSLANSDD